MIVAKAKSMATASKKRTRQKAAATKMTASKKVAKNKKTRSAQLWESVRGGRLAQSLARKRMLAHMALRILKRGMEVKADALPGKPVIKTNVAYRALSLKSALLDGKMIRRHQKLQKAVAQQQRVMKRMKEEFATLNPKIMKRLERSKVVREAVEKAASVQGSPGQK